MKKLLYSECIFLMCMYKVRSSTQVKGTKRMRTQLTLRVHEDVAVRHERLLLHADACRQSAVRLAGCVCVCVCVCLCVSVQRVSVVVAVACSSCRRSGTGSLRSHSARQCSHRRCPSLRRALASPPSARTSVCARFAFFSHVVWFRRMISPGSAPARNTLSSPRTTPRRPPGAPSRAPTPRRRHFEMPACWDSNSLI